MQDARIRNEIRLMIALLLSETIPGQALRPRARNLMAFDPHPSAGTIALPSNNMADKINGSSRVRIFYELTPEGLGSPEKLIGKF